MEDKKITNEKLPQDEEIKKSAVNINDVKASNSDKVEETGKSKSDLNLTLDPEVSLKKETEKHVAYNDSMYSDEKVAPKFDPFKGQNEPKPLVNEQYEAPTYKNNSNENNNYRVDYNIPSPPPAPKRAYDNDQPRYQEQNKYPRYVEDPRNNQRAPRNNNQNYNSQNPYYEQEMKNNPGAPHFQSGYQGQYNPQNPQYPPYGNNMNSPYGYNNFQYPPGYFPKSKMTALLLCIFLGVFGIHRFYIGKYPTGILYLFTGSLFGIGWLVDIILIASGSMRDAYGYPLVW